MAQKEQPYLAQWILFFILGLLNNVVGVVVLSAARSLAESFDKSNNIGALQLSNTFLGLIVAFLAGSLLLKLQTKWKMLIVLIFFLGGLIIISVATKVSFELAIIGILSCSGASALGQATLLGSMKSYDSRVSVGSWSSGTGAAGLVGTFGYILFHGVAELSNLTIFASLVPFSIIYYVCYLLVSGPFGPGDIVDFASQEGNKTGIIQPLLSDEENPSDYALNSHTSNVMQRDSTQIYLDSQVKSFNSKDADIHRSMMKPSDSLSEFQNNSNNTVNPLFSTDSTERFSNSNGYGSINQNTNTGNDIETLIAEHSRVEQQQIQQIKQDYEEKLDKETLFTQLARVWPIVGFSAIMLMLIYFLEYVIISLFANHMVNISKDDPNITWIQKYMYEILQFCYQIGVFVSRTGGAYFTIKRTWVLTFVQFCNLILWAFNAQYHFIQPLWVLFPLMIFVGLNAGYCYVTSFVNLQANKDLKRDKELAVNVYSIGISIGITSSALLTILCDHTWFKG